MHVLGHASNCRGLLIWGLSRIKVVRQVTSCGHSTSERRSFPRVRNQWPLRRFEFTAASLGAAALSSITREDCHNRHGED
jgi:hypothetical protein